MWSNQKNKALSYINYDLFNVIKCLFFGHSLGARAEICQIVSLVIKKNILKLSDLYCHQPFLTFCRVLMGHLNNTLSDDTFQKATHLNSN